MSDTMSFSDTKTPKIKRLHQQTVRPTKMGNYLVEKKERESWGMSWGKEQLSVKYSEKGRIRR